MNKETYLTEIRSLLLRKLSVKETVEIVNELKLNIDERLAMGEDFDDIRMSIGSPSFVSDDFIAEEVKSSQFLRIIRWPIGAFILFYSFINLLNSMSWVNHVFWNSLFTVITPVGIWIIMRGDLRPARFELSKSGFSKAFMVYCSIFALYLITTIPFFIHIVVNVGAGKLQRIGFVALFILVLIYSINLIIYQVYIYYQSGQNYFPYTFVIIGILYTTLSVYVGFFDAYQDRDYLEAIRLLAPLATGIVTCFGSLSLSIKLEERLSKWMHS